MTELIIDENYYGLEKEEFLSDPIKYANGFHRVISKDVEKIT